MTKINFIINPYFLLSSFSFFSHQNKINQFQKKKITPRSKTKYFFYPFKKQNHFQKKKKHNDNQN